MRFLAAILALGAALGAAAQVIGERWIVERIVAGRYEELRAVKAESDGGSPVAMYWWGVFLEGCLYEGCDTAAANALWLRAAAAGNSDAKLAVLFTAQTPAEMEALLAKLGTPVNLEEKLGYAYVMATISVASGLKDAAAWEKSRALLKELADDRRLAAIYAVGGMEGFKPYAKELRAMVEAGFSPAAEQYRRWLLLSERSDYAQLLKRARAGDLVVGAALCETAGVSEGYEALPAELLRVCERAVSQGYTGVLPALLRHHHKSGNAKAAAFFAELCAAHAPVKCASDLADYYLDTSGKSPSWELWDLVAAGAGVPASETGKPPALLRQSFSIRTRVQLMERSCVLRRYDPAAGKFEADARCEWRRPMVIPADYLKR